MTAFLIPWRPKVLEADLPFFMPGSPTNIPPPAKPRIRYHGGRWTAHTIVFGVPRPPLDDEMLLLGEALRWCSRMNSKP